MAEFKLLTYFSIMITINVLLFLVQGGVTAVNNGASFWNNGTNSPATTFLSDGTLAGGLGADADDFNEQLVTSDSVEEDTGNIFTDTFKTVKQWFNNLNTRFRLLGALLGQPYGFLKDIGVPIPIATSFALIWYVIAIILLVSFIKGGSAE